MKKYFIILLAALGLAACKDPQVEPQGEKLRLNQSEVSISVSETFQLSANISVTWASSDYSVASVSSTGLVQGVKEGVATITASSVDNQKATCKVTVTSDSGGGDDPVVEKPAYLIEFSIEYTNVSEGLNIQPGLVSKTVYERGEGDNVKYVYSVSTYGRNGLSTTVEYTHAGREQYGVCTYSNNAATPLGMKDTTIYLDDARLYTKETRSGGSRTVTDYDSEQRMTKYVIYINNQVYQETSYTYSNGKRYGIGFAYPGESKVEMRDTIDFLDLSYDYRTSTRQATWSYSSDNSCTYTIEEYKLEGKRRKSCDHYYRYKHNDTYVESFSHAEYTWYNDWDYTVKWHYEDDSYNYDYEQTYKYRQ